MTARTTSSALERLARCPWSGGAPGVSTEDAFSERGTGTHRFVVRATAAGRDTALAEVPEGADWRRLCERIDIEALPWWPGRLPADATLHMEETLAVDPTSGAVRAIGSDEEYRAVDEWHHAGTPDVAVDIPSLDEVWLWDIKVRAPHEMMLASENAQLRAYALMFAALKRRRRARVAITHIYTDATVLTPPAHLYDAVDLYESLAWLAGIVADVRAASRATEQPKLTRGAWCRYCPRFLACPAQQEVFRQFVYAVRSEMVPAVLPNDVAEARVWLRSAKLWLGELDEAIRRHASVRPVPTDKPGVVYRSVSTPTRVIVDHEKAITVLRMKFGEDVAVAAMTTSTSVVAIESAIDAYARKRSLKIAPTIREAMELLRAAGALRDEDRETLRETDEG